MRKEYLLGDLERELKKLYGNDAKVEVVEPIIVLDNSIRTLNSFDGKAAIILHLNKKSYTFECPIDREPQSKVYLAKNNQAIIIPVPTKELSILGDDGTKRKYNLCVKYEIPFYYADIDTESIKNLKIDKKYIEPIVSKNKAFKMIIDNIDCVQSRVEDDFEIENEDC